MCRKQEVAAVDQSEFLSMCGLIEARGLFAVKKAKETRLVKVGFINTIFLPGSVAENAKPLITLAQVVDGRECNVKRKFCLFSAAGVAED